MPTQKINRIMIAGTNSGCGKTTITCAILKALMNQGLQVASFKCGPDYIDPMFHSEVIGAHSRNIDLFLCGEHAAGYLFAMNSNNADISLVEGVMGFYDGMGGNSFKNSSYDISMKLNIPVVLVVGCKGASLSIVAMIKGFLELYPNHIKAVILNNVSKAMYPIYKEMIEEKLKIKVLGFLPHEPKAELESRHLGLVTAGELTSLQDKIELLAKNAAENIDLTGLINLAGIAGDFTYNEIDVMPLVNVDMAKVDDVEVDIAKVDTPKVNIAVARDKAFCFYYEDSLNLLEQLGANLIPFSPLQDKSLPSDIDGCLFGGGYPELYLKQLSSNTAMLKSIREAHHGGLPIYAECGGYMYLGKKINGEAMAGIINMSCSMTSKLQNFGYVNLAAKKDNFLMKQEERIPAHEFHYSVSDNKEHALTVIKSEKRSWEGGYMEDNIFALYPHLHFWGNIELAKRLIRKCEEYRDGK